MRPRHDISKTVARELDAALVVDHAKIRANIDVVFEREIEFWLFANDLHHLVVFFLAGKKVGIGDVGHTSERVVDFVDKLVDLGIALCNLFAEFSHLVKDRLNGLSRLFEHGDLRRNLVLLRFELLYLGDCGFSLVVPCDDVGKVCLIAFFARASTTSCGLFLILIRSNIICSVDLSVLV